VNGKRPHELELIRIIIEEKYDVIPKIERLLKSKYAITADKNTRINLINQMTQNFITGSARKSYIDAVFIEERNGVYDISPVFENCLRDMSFLDSVYEMIDIGLEINNERYSERYNGTNFVLYEKYTYDDVCRLLDWSKSIVPQNIGGYKYDEDTKTLPVFINYNKSEDISHSIQYHDRFLSPSDFIGISKSQRTLNSMEVKRFYSAETDGIRISLFIRKNKEDKISKEFYYLGPIHSTGKPNQFVMKNANKPAVEIQYKIKVPVREDLYDYLISD
jgi:hypothetical protein